MILVLMSINYFSDIYSKWDKKTEQTEQQYLSGEITNPEAVLRDWAATINAVFTPVSDATGAALSAADEAFLSGAGGRGLEAAGEVIKVGTGVKNFKVGDKVAHKVFGDGIIIGCKPIDEDQELQVAFKDGIGIKKLLGSFAKLEEIN